MVETGSRILRVTAPLTRGTDVQDVQRKLGVDHDGVYGKDTAAAVLAWKKRIGYPDKELTDAIGPRGINWLLGKEKFPPDYVQRAKQRAAEVTARQTSAPRVGLAGERPVPDRRNAADDGARRGDARAPHASSTAAGSTRSGSPRPIRGGAERGMEARSSTVVSGLMARETERLSIGWGIISPFTRHPVQVAMDARVVQELAPGRFLLGFGTSKIFLNNIRSTSKKTLGPMREAIDIVRGMLGSGAFEYGARRSARRCRRCRMMRTAPARGPARCT